MIVLDSVDDLAEHSQPHGFDKQHIPLVSNAASFSGRNASFERMNYAEPITSGQELRNDFKPTIWSQLTGNDSARYPLDQRIEDKRRGIGRQKYPYISWTLTTVMIGVFIYESVVNWRAQGTPFSFHPIVNPMLGPSTSALIHVGARFVHA